jgi:Mrp family chromosome partitioning ATPase
VSTEAVSSPRLARLHPGARKAGSASVSRAEAAAQARRLVPGELLDGCRQALQRVAAPGVRSYGITSSIRGEGRTSVALGFALVEWLDHERRTVVVDLDFEAPELHRRLDLPDSPGISELVEGHNNVEDFLQRAVGDVWLLSAGPSLDGDAPRCLSRLAQSTVMSQLVEWADTVVFDLPPILGTPTGLEAARLCGTPVMVIRAGVTPLARIKEATDALPAPPPVIVNGVSSSVPRWLRRMMGDVQ